MTDILPQVGLLEAIANGDHDADLDAIVNAVEIRRRSLAPWTALSALTDIMSQVEMNARGPLQRKANVGAECNRRLRAIYRDHADNPLVRPLIDLARTEVFVQLLDIPREQVTKIRRR